MYATGLAGPSSEATVAGSTKIPDPMTPFTAMAINPNNPTALKNRGAAEPADGMESGVFKGLGQIEDEKSQMRSGKWDIIIDRTVEWKPTMVHSLFLIASALFRIDIAVPPKICCFSCSGIGRS